MGVPLEPPGYRWQWSIAQLRANQSPVYVQEFIRLLADRPPQGSFTPRAARPRRFTSPGRADLLRHCDLSRPVASPVRPRS